MGKRTGAWEGFDGWMLGRPHRMVPPENAARVPLVKKGKCIMGKRNLSYGEISVFFEIVY